MNGKKIRWFQWGDEKPCNALWTRLLMIQKSREQHDNG